MMEKDGVTKPFGTLPDHFGTLPDHFRTLPHHLVTLLNHLWCYKWMNGEDTLTRSRSKDENVEYYKSYEERLNVIRRGNMMKRTMARMRPQMRM